MFDFHSVGIEDAKWATPLLYSAERASCEYAFVNLFAWGDMYRTQIAVYDGFVVARSESPKIVDNSPYSYLFPMGGGDRKNIVQMMIDDAKNNNRAMRLYSLSRSNVTWLEENFAGMFEYTSNRNDYDYIYDTAALQTLAGKKLQKKRNHISRFEKENPEYIVEKITPQNINEVIDFDDKWANLDENTENKGIVKEHKAVDRVLQNYFDLKLFGCLVRVEGSVVAFSYGAPISKRVFCTHVEKADYEVNGAYNIINREFAKMFCNGYIYINREDDVGSEGLRKAKLSYQPKILYEKHIATLKGV